MVIKPGTKMKVIRLLFFIFSMIQLLSCTSQVPPAKISTEQSEDITSLNALLYDNGLDRPNRSPLLLSKDFGKTWEDVSFDLPDEVQVSFLEQFGDEIILATDNMGIFFSSNNRTKWTQIGASLPNQKINALYLAENTIYAGVYRSGIFKSEDEGKTWKSINFNLPNLNVQAICNLDRQLLVGTDAGIFILPTNKQVWKASSVLNQVVSLYEYNGILVAGTSQGTVISKDSGHHWSWIREEGAVHYTHNIGERIIELVLNGDLYYSDDWGANWKEIAYEPREGSYVYEIVKAGTYLLMSNNYGIHRSADDGEHWELIYKTESMAFFDFLVIDNEVYGGTRAWDEYRKRNH